MLDSDLSSQRESIAIIGMGCRLPGSSDSPEAYWKLLREGRNAIVEIPDSRWNQARFYSPQGFPGKTLSQWAGLVDDIDAFDPTLFGISPREAAKMDPQQRMLLEVSWRAMEDAGIPQSEIMGRNVGVFVGIASWDYSLIGLNFEDRGHIDAYNNTGSTLSIAANRISYCFDLRGPSFAVDTACSSSLMAIHLACQSLWSGQTSMALAGGVNALLMPDFFISFSQLGVLSPDGCCKTFDARANGYVRSEGAGMILLKPLSAALRDGDRIYAVVRGSASNQDGRTPGLTVPSPSAQAELIRTACQSADIHPSQVQYVEAHGTGTPVGDPIEFRAIAEVIGKAHGAHQPCRVASVKTNIGHLEAGAGIASVIKVALAIHHGEIPAHRHFQTPHPEIDLVHSGLCIPTEHTAWESNGALRTAGVNGFGYGGANVHLILQEVASPWTSAALPEHPTSNAIASAKASLSVESPDPLAVGDASILLLSAKSEEALVQHAQDWVDWLDTSGCDHSLAEIQNQLAHRSNHFDYRLALVGRDHGTWRHRLTEAIADRTRATHHPVSHKGPLERKLVFACCGQGPQAWNMGRGLYAKTKVGKQVLEACDQEFSKYGPWSLIQELHRPQFESRMQRTAIAQPALFAIQLALAAYWKELGILPSVLVGHSVGEIAAAYLAGGLSWEDACCVAFHRGRTMDQVTSHGKMAAVGLSLSEIEPWLAPHAGRIVVSAVNSPQSLTLSGDALAMDALVAALQKSSAFVKALNVEYAFHSPQMEPVREALLEALAHLTPRPCSLPFYSTVYGESLGNRLLDAEYWWKNVRQPVLFGPCMERLAEQGYATVVELGPHPVLSFAIHEAFGASQRSVETIASLRRDVDDQESLLNSVGRLHQLGHKLEWAQICPPPQRILSLPKHPFLKQALWSESSFSRRARLAPIDHPLLGVKAELPKPSWLASLDLRQFPCMADHQVRQVCVLPAAAVLDSCLGLSRIVSSDSPTKLRHIRMETACLLHPDRPKQLLHELDPEDRSLRVSVRENDSSEWHTLARMQIATAIADPPARLNLEAIRQQCSHSVERGRVYAYCQRLGLQYGKLFQGIKHGYQGHHQCLVRVELDAQLVAEAPQWIFHPALLDACFHSMIVFDPAFDQYLDGLYLPYSIEEVQLYDRPGQSLWVHAELISKTDERMIANLSIADDSGNVIATIQRFESRRLASTREQQEFPKLLYRNYWNPSSIDRRSEDSENEPNLDGELLCIIGYCSSLSDELAERWQQRGGQVVHWGHPQSENHADSLIGAGLLQFPALEKSLGSEPPLASQRITMVYVDGLNAPSNRELEVGSAKSDSTAHQPTAKNLADSIPIDSLDSVSQKHVQQLRDLLRSWEEVLPGRSARLLICTAGAQSLDFPLNEIVLSQTPLVGMARVVISEVHDWQTRLIDLDPSDVESWVESLSQELGTEDGEDEVLWRDHQRYVCRFHPYLEQPLWSPLHEQVRYQLPIDDSHSLDGLGYRTCEARELADHEVELEVLAASLNFSDVMKGLGLYPGKRDDDRILGAECAGIVRRRGAKAHRFALGQEVIAVAPGAFASHVVVAEDLVSAQPQGWNYRESATVPIAFLTADYAMNECARLKPHEMILIHAATGGVGMAALQLAHRIRAIPLASAGSESKRQMAIELGAEAVVDSRSMTFADQLAQQGFPKVDAILNSLPGEAIPIGLSMLNAGGRFLEIGKRDIYNDASLGLFPFRNNVAFFGIDLDQLFQKMPHAMGQRLRKLVEQMDRGELRPLTHQTFTADQTLEAFRWMQQGKHVGKIVIDYAERPSKIFPGVEHQLKLRDQATYWVVGGRGGFGLQVVKWLADHGAKSIVVSGRSLECPPDVAKVFEELRDRQVKVWDWPCDVTQPKDCRAIVDRIQRELPPLAGVFHTAMVLKDQLIVDSDDDTLRQVLRPKVLGGYHLHAATQHLSLDHFVLFSSLSSIFGHAGQANYAAANAFLDGLARHRRALKLPALVVNWGHLGGVGYLARRSELSERLERQGVLSFPVSQALQCLELAMASQEMQLSVLNMDWSVWRGLGVTTRQSPRFAHLLRDHVDSASDTNPSAKSMQQLRSEGPVACQNYFEQQLAGKISQLLGIELRRVSLDTPLLDLGLDSLMAVELRNWIQSQFGITLPVGSLMRNADLHGVSRMLTERVLEEATEMVPAKGKDSPSPTLTLEQAQEILDNLDSLKEDELDYWLEQLQNAGLLPSNESA